VKATLVHRSAASIVVLVVLVAQTGCGEDSLAPFEPAVTNATDNFQFQATGLTGVTTTVAYTWQNTGTAATVNQSSAIPLGTGVLTIGDAAGTQVYSASLNASGTPTTATGVAGAWTIRVELVNAQGTVNFRVQKV
jgi:hypothetical protein